MDANAAGCPAGADNRFGPRVDPSCRSFDFTLLFEDAIFTALPAALLLLLIPIHLWRISRTTIKMDSYILATWKLVLFLVLLSQIPRLTTSLSLASGVLATAAVLAASVLSFLKDQRSTRPSDILVLYFSACTLLAIPQLRTLWLMPSNSALKATLTVKFIATVAVVVAESSRKNKFLSQPYKKLPTEETVSFWNRGLFVWILPFFKLGYSKHLVLHDIPAIGSGLEGAASWTKLQRSWNRVTGRHRLLRATFRANIAPFVSGLIPRLTLSCFSFAQPFLISTSVSNLQLRESDDRSRYGRALVGAFVLTYTGIAIYQDTTALRYDDIKDSAAVTLMGTDVERIYESLMQVHEIWASTIEIIIAVWLLMRQVSYAAIAPLAICLISIGGASQIGNRFGPATATWIQRVQKRVAVTASFLNDIKAVKMLGLSDVLYGITVKLRKDELHASVRFRRLLVLQILTGNAPTLLAPFATFVVYAVIAKIRKDETLLAAQAFASLSLVSLTTQPLILLCEALPRIMQAVACFRRIEEYCAKVKEDTSPSGGFQGATGHGMEMERRDTLANSTSGLVSFEGACISWTTLEEKDVLHNLNLKIRPGFTAIVGPIAAGKSTLLASIIGQTIVREGYVSQVSSKVAFCSQTPWIIDDTIRRNIIGDQDTNETWYDFAITSSCLKKDLMRLPLGDEFSCGSKGVSLSSGQRQRLLPVVILDDIMSGFDSQTTGNILASLFSETGYFRKAGISVILATHSRRILPYMDSVVVLDNGRVAEADSYEHVRLRPGTILETAIVDQDSAYIDEDEPKRSRAIPSVDENQETALEQDLLHRRMGSWSVYSYYCRSAGAVSLVLWVIFTFVGAITASYTAIWIQQWTNVNEEHPNEKTGLYLGIYALLVVLSIGGTAGECWTFFVNIINDTALKLHDDLLKATLGAPYHFFHTTNTGSITNRFSQDMDLIDMTLPVNAITFTTAAASCLVQLVIICIVGKYLAATTPVLVFVLFAVQRYYLRTSRQLRLMDIEAKAPIYKLFLETIQGVATIRAFGWSAAFHKRQYAVLNESQKPLYMLASIQQWLALVLDLIVGGLAVVIVASATATASSVSAGALGVALVLVLQFSSLLTQCVQSWTKLETSIGAVARVQEFIKNTPSEAPGTLSLPINFPQRGAIHCDSLTSSYKSPFSDPVLKHIELGFAPGEKIALCGPSGSGKSSLIMSILLMMEFREGRVTIDDMDISRVEGNSLRMQLNVVPQEPFFLPGTVKLNIDPKGKSSNESIVAALSRVGLWDKIDGNGGLDADLDPSELSYGEKQLLCLARALLVPSKILILDEAMSRYDIIDSEFKHQTVISVLHRFSHIHSYDKVVVLRNGKLVESGTPEGLLESDSAFRALYDAQK
ncbi:ABC transporter [Trichoderma velutinum]